MAKIKTVQNNKTRRIRPATTPDAREQQLISLAVDLVEQRLLDGTASSQETTHFLKLASSDYKLKLQRLEEENKLLRAKTEAIESNKRVEELYQNAIKAMKRYGGHSDTEEDEYEY